MNGIAFIIPTLNEARILPGLLRDLRRVTADSDIVVADGGSKDGTVDVAHASGARVVCGAPGRGAQMNAGAAASKAPWLCFLHADVRLPTMACRELEQLGDGVGAAVWRLRINSSKLIFRFIEFAARARDVVGGLPYGDQGLLVKRSLFESVGGFVSIPLMEDVVMVREIRRRTKLYHFRSAIVVSPRRWENDGPLRRSAKNTVLLTAFLLGISPYRLADWYPIVHRD